MTGFIGRRRIARLFILMSLAVALLSHTRNVPFNHFRNSPIVGKSFWCEIWKCLPRLWKKVLQIMIPHTQMEAYQIKSLAKLFRVLMPVMSAEVYTNLDTGFTDAILKGGL